MPFNYHDQANIQQGLGSLLSVIQQWKRDKQANDIVNTLRPPRAAAVDPNADVTDGYTATGTQPFTGGYFGAELQNKLQDEDVNRQYKRALITKALREPVSSKAAVGEDGLTPYQRAQLKLSNARETRLGRTGKIPAGERSDSMAALDHDARRKFGIGISDMPDIKGVAAGNVDDKGVWTPADNGAYWQFHTHSGEVFTQPKEEIAPFLRRFRALKTNFKGADVYKAVTSAPQSDTPFSEPDLPTADPAAAADSGASKPLDPNTAKAILSEAGGDKDKAREIARQRGYSF